MLLNNRYKRKRLRIAAKMWGYSLAYHQARKNILALWNGYFLTKSDFIRYKHYNDREQALDRRLDKLRTSYCKISKLRSLNLEHGYEKRAARKIANKEKNRGRPILFGQSDAGGPPKAST